MNETGLDWKAILDVPTNFLRIEIANPWGRANLVWDAVLTTFVFVWLIVRYRLVSRAITSGSLRDQHLLIAMREIGLWKPVLLFMAGLAFCAPFLWMTFQLIGKDM